MKMATHSMSIKAETENMFPEPFKTILGKADWRGLSDLFELSQFGVNMEVLYPQAQSALRHWHTKTDEFIFVLDGELVLVTDEGETHMIPGTCAGFKAGEPNGHHLVNRSEKAARFLVVGARVKDDKAHYPDDDFQWIIGENGSWQAARKDGSRY